MMNRVLLGAAALAMAVPAIAQMQPGQPVAPTAPMTPRMDATHTRDQVIAKVRDHFARVDTNRDGFVAGDEMRAQRGQRGGDRMARRAGAMRDPSAMFDRLDANRDNMISRDEFSRGHEMRKQHRAERVGQQGTAGAANALHHGDRRGMKMHRMGGMMRGRMLRMADANQDGRVSLQEATTSALQRFDRVDANRDGRITPDERRQNRELRRQSRAPKAG